ncbi:ParB-like protein [Cupriavidus sp. 30B13]|uniref:ParB-like protein n=1 Tax=Cupriavidus sp. 30B13 TaxID=3384241 RepID=UPI003B9093D9
MIAPLGKGSKLVIPIDELRPTQITVGWYHVEQKMHATARRGAHQRPAFLERHRLDVVMGPEHVAYVVDHHHWVRAWHELGIHAAPVLVLRDLSALAPAAFWQAMLKTHSVHPYDEHGRRLPVSALPERVGDMRDDPYRSLEAFVQLAGGYRKVRQAYPDFRWADFFRRHVGGPLDTVDGFAEALARAVQLARSGKARGLPGYLGAVR